MVIVVAIVVVVDVVEVLVALCWGRLEQIVAKSVYGKAVSKIPRNVN